VSERIEWVDLAAPLGSASVRRSIAAVLDSGRLIGGAEVASLEAEVAQWMGRSYGVAVSSGTTALELGLSALKVGRGSEVIVPAVSFVATVGAVLRVGATPVVVDIGAGGPWMDPAAAEAAVGPNTALFLPVHLFGSSAPAPQSDLPVMDDACQAVCPGGPSIGRLTAVSFYPTKVLGGLGDGGMVLSDDMVLADRVRALRQHGCDATGMVVEVGGTNARLDAVSAAVIRARMDTTVDAIERRRSIADRYDKVVGTNAVPRSRSSPVSVYALRCSDRDRIVAELESEGIPTQVYYPRLVHDHPAIRDRVRIAGSLDNAIQFCGESLALPCHAGLSEEQVGHIVRVLERVL
jgi:UDP-2-acetamido-2-deoxy-ribo-hexuluronate aminotransferase